MPPIHINEFAKQLYSKPGLKEMFIRMTMKFTVSDYRFNMQSCAMKCGCVCIPVLTPNSSGFASMSHA